MTRPVTRGVFLAAMLLLLSTGSRRAEAAPLPLGFDKNAVQFIFQKSGTNFFPAGTCFAVDVTSSYRPKQFKHILGWCVTTLMRPLPIPSTVHFPPPYCGPIKMRVRYFVTAKHVLFDTSGNIRPELYFRFNKQDGGISNESLSANFANGTLRILTHTNQTVDLVAFTLSRGFMAHHPPSEAKPGPLKVESFNDSILADKKAFEKRYIREGDEMFFVGLFPQFYGTNENLPICRFGHIAMLPGESIPTELGPAQFYLMEAVTFGGNSGSPAFFYFPSRWRGRPLINGIPRKPFLLAGVVKGYFHNLNSTENVGVTLVVPAYYLHDLLYGQDEKTFRQEAFKASFPHGF
jgi:hypothetical protein